MATIDSNSLKYLTGALCENSWGVEVTTVGFQSIEPNANYPAMQHPVSYDFRPNNGRVLDEYQIVYITEGGGYFESASLPKCRVEGGTVMLLFPGERHSYAPDASSGWSEFWLGFRGEYMDRIMRESAFTKSSPLINVGLSNTMISLYREAIRLAEREKIGSQQLIAGIVFHLLGLIYYKYRNRGVGKGYAEEIINEARQIMRENLHHTLRAEDVAKQLGVGYSWFRQAFKRTTGVSPSRYMMLLLVSHAKELLLTEDCGITETAYRLGFESVGQFSTLFRKVEGVTPSRFREERKRGF
jgi:AraC-like DNA-binding protein